MTDLLALKRMNDVIEAINKMHNGLLALIDDHHRLEQELNERIKKLENKDSATDTNAQTRPA